MLTKSGFGDVTTLLGGLPAWQEAGYELAAGDSGAASTGSGH